MHTIARIRRVFFNVLEVTHLGKNIVGSNHTLAYPCVLPKRISQLRKSCVYYFTAIHTKVS